MKTNEDLNPRIYERLPKTLKETCNVIENSREKELILVSTIGVLSGALSTVYGTYDGKRCYPNLYVFVVAGPGTGKGTMKFAKTLVEKKHESIVSNQDGNGNNMLFIPANSSAAAMYDALEATGGLGIVFDTEADNLASALMAEWGNHSSEFRKGYHNEPISLLRRGSEKSQRRSINIPRPRFSVVLSGTPNQVFELVKSELDGLFSRFLYINYQGVLKWRDVFSTTECLDDKFEALADQYTRIIDYNLENDFQLTVSEDQRNFFNKYFETIQEADVPDSVPLGCVRRLGLATFKICMVLSAIRRFENGDREKKVECHDDDFSAAIDLSKFFLHSLKEIIGKVETGPYEKSEALELPGKADFFAALPDKFKRNEAVEIGEGRFDDSTVDKFLRKLRDEGLLKSPKYSYYEKVKIE